MKLFVRILFMSLGTLVCGVYLQREGAASDVATGCVLVVLGNEPLDDHTPTIDMIARVDKAVGFQRANPNCLLVFTGGPTAGAVSEARMMSRIAIAAGVSTNSIRLEERARTTSENARFTAQIVSELHPQNVFIVSKADHLGWAMRAFREYNVFKNAKPMICSVHTEKSIAQMREYLVKHPDNDRVHKRLQALLHKEQGAD